MSKFNKKNRIGMLIFVYLAMIAAFAYLLAIPGVKRAQDMADQIEKKNMDNQKSRDRISQIPIMENAYDEYQSQKDKMDILLGNDQTIDYIKKIEAIAESTGNKIDIKISDIVDKTNEKPVAAPASATSPTQPAVPAPTQPSKPNEEKGITDTITYKKYLPVQVTLQGDFQGLVNFMNKVENDQNFVNITSLQIKESLETVRNVDLNNDIFQAVNQMSEGSGEKTSPPPPPKPKQVIASNISLIIYLKK